MVDEDRSNLALWMDLLRRRGIWIPACVLLAAFAAFAASRSQATRYTATASLLFKSNSFSQQIAGLPSNVGAAAEQNNSLRLVKFSDVAGATAAASGGRLSEREILESVSVSEEGEVSFPGESSVVVVTATAKSAPLAAEIANAYAKQFVTQQRAANRQYFQSALSVVEKQLNSVPRHQRFSTAAVALQTRAESLHLLSELQYGGVELGRPAAVPTSPSAPRTARNVAIGVALGLLVGLCLAFLLERLDGRVRDPMELERIYEVPMLGAVPTSRTRFARGARRGPLSEDEAASFGLMLAHLRSFNSARELRTVLIGSPEAGEGKSTIAIALAEACARAGGRALVLEGNLRRPVLADRLDLRNAPGLTSVLAGAMTLDEAAQPLQLRETSGRRSARGRLDVLVAGGVEAADPSELLGGQRMAAMLAQAKFVYDLVILDTSPLGAVPDAFPLVGLVDGVIVVGAVGVCRGDAVRRLRQVLQDSGAPVVGVIANRVRAHRPRRYAVASAGVAATGVEDGPLEMSAQQGTRSAARV